MHDTSAILGSGSTGNLNIGYHQHKTHSHSQFSDHGNLTEWSPEQGKTIFRLIFGIIALQVNSLASSTKTNGLYLQLSRKVYLLLRLPFITAYVSKVVRRISCHYRAENVVSSKTNLSTFCQNLCVSMYFIYRKIF